MRLTNKNTGISFNLTPKEAADFFCMTDKDGNLINYIEEYERKDTCKEISSLKFYLGMTGLIALCYVSFYLYLQFNY